MTKARQYFVLPALPIATFLTCTIFLQTKKAPWVDECYTYYGITHNTFGQFADSICSGVNFSPPLYFFLNWMVQLVFQIPLEALRVESALWISLGSLLMFLRCAKTFGLIAAFLGLSMILLQSDLLMEQALEARHYGMFFACSSLVLFLFPENINFLSKTHKFLYFIGLLALGLTHYLGIIFCIIAGITRLWHLRKESTKISLILPEISSMFILATIYLLFLSIQSSHLGNWPRPNDVKSLLHVYLSSISPLTILIVVVPFLFLPIKRGSENSEIKRKSHSPVLTVSVLWLLAPLFFWILSHIWTLNLFKERYFIPKEAAIILLITFAIHAIMKWFDELKPTAARIMILVPYLASLGIFALNAKRVIFSLNPTRNYHSKLIIDNNIINDSIPKVFFGDHLYFPNIYQTGLENKLLLVENKQIEGTYKRFNKNLNMVTQATTPAEAHILIKHHDQSDEFWRAVYVIPDRTP